MHQKPICLLAAGALLLAATSTPAAPPVSSVSNLWGLAFEENFDGSMLNTNAWSVTDNCAGVICRHPENVEVSGGTLKLKTLAANPLVDPPEVSYTTGRVDSSFLFNIGYAEVRMRAAEDSGIQSSVFTALAGNILPNLAQTFEGDSNDGLTDWNFINGVGGSFGAEFIFDSSDPFPGATDLSAAFHDFALNWTEANELIWRADGVETARAQMPAGLYGSPAAFAIGSAIRNEDFGITRDPIGTAMEVDRVRFYSKRDVCLGCDSFDYSAGSLAGGNGGKGWAGPWSITTGSVDVEGLGDNLGLTGAEVSAPAGDRALGVAGSIAVRSLAAPGVQLGVDGSTYVSMLVHKDDAGDFQISFRRSSDSAVRWYFGGNAAEAAFTGMQSTVTAAGKFPANETVLVLAKLAAVATGTDTVSVAVLRAGDLIPQQDSAVTWAVTGTGNSAIILDYLDVNVYAGEVQIDEIKIGATLADVITPGGAPSNAESFDYADADLEGKSGGTGWNGPWLAAMALSNDDVSLSYPNSPSTESLLGNGDLLVLSDGVAERTIADNFSLAEDNTYFMSFMANKTSDSDLLIEGLDVSNNSRWRVGLSGVNEVLGGITSVVSSTDDDGSVPGSLSYPPAVALSTNGSRIEHSGPGSAYRALSSATPSSTNGAQRWLSFLARKNAAGTFNVRVANTSNQGRWNVEVAADGTVRAEIFGGVNSAAGTFPNDESVMVLTQFVGAAGASFDSVKIAIIGQGDALPPDAASIVWDAQVAESTSVTMNRLIVETVTGLVEVDEFRYGETYESVTTTGFTLYDTDAIDYSAGAIGGQGPWSGDLNVAGVPSNSLSYPALTPAFPFTPAGGRVDHTGTASATHPLSVVVAPDGGFKRWMSFIAKKDATGSFAVRTKEASSGFARWNLEFNANGSVRSEIFGGTTSAAGIFPNGENVLVIARLIGDTAGMDTADILLLRAGDALPASEHDIDTNSLWDVRHTESTSVYMDTLVLEAITGRVQLDEFRYGSTYASVTTSGSFLFDQFSFPYAGGPIEGNGEWTGDLNVAGPVGGFANDTVFVLSMFQAHTVGGANTDTVYVKVFRSAYELPISASAITAWDVITSGNTGVFLSKIRVTGAGPGTILLDELKVGTTYASVTNYTAPGDCDGDGDADLDDFVNCFEPCLGGPGLGLSEGCGSADLDGDNDVDLRDYALFVQSF